MLELRLKVQSEDVERKARALGKVEKRELATLERDQRRDQRDQRERTRGFDASMPSLAEIVGHEPKQDNPAPDVLSAFDRVKLTQREQVPDLMSALPLRQSRALNGMDAAGQTVDSTGLNGRVFQCLERSVATGNGNQSAVPNSIATHMANNKNAAGYAQLARERQPAS